MTSLPANFGAVSNPFYLFYYLCSSIHNIRHTIFVALERIRDVGLVVHAAHVRTRTQTLNMEEIGITVTQNQVSEYVI